MEFHLLGSFEVLDDGRPVAIGGGKRRSLLALLLLHRNQLVSADRLIDVLWDERPPPTAAKGLQVHVSQLRKELATGNGDLLVTRAGGYVLQLGPADTDIQRFERAVEDGTRALAAGQAEKAGAFLREGLSLWRGPPLADFAYEPFAQAEIARLEELRIVAIEQRIDADLALGRHAQLVGELELLVREHPLRERLRGQLMLALYRCDRQAEALEAYREGRRLLVDELGLEPGAGLRDLEAGILEQRPELAAPAPAPASRGRPRDAPAAAPVAPPGPPAVRRRMILLTTAAALLLGAAVAAAILREDRATSLPPAAVLDLASNSIVAVDPVRRSAVFALPLPGRPTDIAAAGGRVVAVSVDSDALTAGNADTRTIVRQVPLPMTPAAVAIGEGGVWVVDRGAGLLARLEPGYAKVSARIRFRRRQADTTTPRGDTQRRTASVAAGLGSVWVTDGSIRLARVDPRTSKVTAIDAGRSLDGVTVGADAVWAISSRTATVLRVDPRTADVTDRIGIARPGIEAPAPVDVAATREAVWVLNANTATVTRIDPRTREVVARIAIGVDRVPGAIAATDRAVWVANGDGSASRIDPRTNGLTSVWIGESLREVAVDGPHVWVTTTALDQQLPGGKG